VILFAIQKGSATSLVLGLVLTPVGLALLRFGANLGFQQFCGLMIAFCGIAFISFSLPHELYGDIKLVLCVISILAALSLSGAQARWAQALFGFCAALALSADIGVVFRAAHFAILFRPETAVLIACGLIALSAHSRFAKMEGLSSFASGWSVGALVFALQLTGAFLRAHLYGLSIPWLAFAAGGCAALFWRKAELRKPSFFLTAAVAIGLTFAAPRLGAAIAVFAGAVLTGRRIVAILAIVQAIAVLSLSYYSIDWTLIQKAQHFAAAGLVLALAAALARAADKQGGNAAGIAKPALALNALGLVLGFGLMTQATLSAENLLAEGRKIYLPLAPVDPRSLVQGDYMRLNFVTGDLRRMASARGAIQFVADVDSRSAASLKKIAGPSEPLEANQILINGRFKDRGYFIASDAWFFEEGQGKKFEAAKFGILRVGADGRALLEGLADADLQQIR
jgi:uncharacterized membrane-anchored protein